MSLIFVLLTLFVSLWFVARLIHVCVCVRVRVCIHVYDKPSSTCVSSKDKQTNQNTHTHTHTNTAFMRDMTHSWSFDQTHSIYSCVCDACDMTP